MSQVSFAPSVDVLGKIAAFVLSRESNDFRSELYEYLVMVALNVDKDNKGMKKKIIISSIEKDLGVEDLPSVLVNNALLSLGSKGWVKKVREEEDALYFLAQDEKTRLDLLEEQYSKTIVQVRITLRKKMNEKGIILDMNEEAQTFEVFRGFISLVLSKLGRECCFDLISSHGKEVSPFQSADLISELKESLKTIEDTTKRLAHRDVFLDYLNNPDENLSDFLYSLAQSYFFVNVLHLDPECQMLTAESLKQKKVYLDTNIILHAITGNIPRYKAVSQALKLTAQLGIKTLFTKRTKAEFSAFLETKRKFVEKNPPVIPHKRYKKVAGRLSDGLLNDFLLRKEKETNLTFEQYADRLEEISTILKNRYSTEYDDNDYKEVSENADLPTLINIVTKEGQKFGLDKTSDVAEHDAFHILLIQQMRKAGDSDILGPNSWFLTHDRSLFFVEKRFGKFVTFPSSIYVDSWVQLISPLIAAKQKKEARDAYVSLFASRLPTMTGLIDEDVLLSFQGKWMDDEDLTANDIAKILGNRYVKNYYERSEHEEKPIPNEEKERMVESMIAVVKTQNIETARMKKSLTELQAESQKTKSESQQIRSEIERLKSFSATQQKIIKNVGHVLGAALFLLMTIGLYEFFVQVNSVEQWTALISAMILSAAVGAIADLYGYRWLLDRLLRYKENNSQEQKIQK